MYKKTKRAAFPYGVVLLSKTFIIFNACNSSQEETATDDDIDNLAQALKDLWKDNIK